MSNVKNSKLPKTQKTLNFLNFKNLSKWNEVRKEIGIHYRLFMLRTGTVETGLLPSNHSWVQIRGCQTVTSHELLLIQICSRFKVSFNQNQERFEYFKGPSRNSLNFLNLYLKQCIDRSKVTVSAWKIQDFQRIFNFVNFLRSLLVGLLVFKGLII